MRLSVALTVVVLTAPVVTVLPATSLTSANGPTVGAANSQSGPGRVLYVGHRDSNFVSSFEIRRGGPLAEPVHARSGSGPIGITFTPDGRTAYVADVFSNDVAVYGVGRAGVLTEMRPRVREGIVGPSGMAVAPDGRTLYVASQDASELSAFRIAGNGQLRSLGRPVDSGSLLPREVAVTPDGRFLFASHWSTGPHRRAVVSTFGISRDDTLRLRSRTRVGIDAAAMVTSPNGRFLFVDSQTSGQIFVFRIGSGGSLRPAPPSPYDVGRQAEGVAITPDGRHVYVTNVTREAKVWAFALDVRGRLTRVPGSPFRAHNGPEGIAVTPDGRNLYVANSGSHDVTAFSIRERGKLTSPGSFATGGKTPAAFRGVVVRPNQGPVAALAVRAHQAGRPSRLDASGSFDVDGFVARFTWHFGDGSSRSTSAPRVAHTYARTGRFRVTVKVIDNEGCSATPVFTGQTALCNGSRKALAVRELTVRR